MPLPTPAEVAPALRTLAERWATSTLGKRQAFQSWTAVEQLAALQALVGRAPLTEAEAAAAFAGADRRLVGRHLETLSMLGEVREVAGRFGG